MIWGGNSRKKGWFPLPLFCSEATIKIKNKKNVFSSDQTTDHHGGGTVELSAEGAEGYEEEREGQSSSLTGECFLFLEAVTNQKGFFFFLFFQSLHSKND